MTNSVSVIIPAYNEEQNIEAAIFSVCSTLKKTDMDYEIIAINDGSTDTTGTVLNKLAKNKNHFKVIHHPVNRGLGFSFREGVKQACKTHITVFPGDNDMAAESLGDLVKQMESADIVISFIQNESPRGFIRRKLSRIHIYLLNSFFGLNLKYYNGPFICKTSLLTKLPLTSDGHTVYAEVKIRLIKAGGRYKEIPFTHIGRKHGHSKAFSVKNIYQTLSAMTNLVIEPNLR